MARKESSAFCTASVSRVITRLSRSTRLACTLWPALTAKVFVTNRDVGFLEKGMSAQVRVDAFPYTQFGSIPGTLKSVGTLPVEPDAQNPQPRFPAYIQLDRESLSKGGETFAVSAGQSVQANLVLRDKRVITLLTDAVQKALDSLRAIRSKS